MFAPLLQTAHHATRSPNGIAARTLVRPFSPLLTLALLVLVAAAANAADPTGASKSTETPTFRKHVLPLLQRLGCSQLSCHGAFHGQGEFHLSLSGRNPQADWAAIQPHLDVAVPASSRLLEKPTAVIDHGGGERMAVDSPEYQIIAEWIRRGAPLDPDVSSPTLQISPSPFVLASETPLAISVHALWNDGRTQDISALVTVEVQPEESFELLEQRWIAPRKQGVSGRVIVEYAGARASAPLFSPHPPSSSHEPVTDVVDGPQTSANSIDALLAERHRLMNLTPASRCTDTDYLRRCYVSLLGRPPTPAEFRAYQALPVSSRRLALLERLLEHDEFARRWGTWLAMTWGCSPEQTPAMRYASGTMHLDHAELVTCWTDWFAARIAEEAHLDDVLRNVLVATTRDDRTFLEHQAWSQDLRHAEHPQEFYVDKATNDLFWRTYASDNQPDELASVFGATFLGTQFSCAKCHDHPFQEMTQDDYFALNALLDDVRVDAAPKYTHAEKNRLFRSTLLIAAAATIGLGLVLTLARLLHLRWLTISITTLSASLAVAALYTLSSFAYLVNPAWAGTETAIGVSTGKALASLVENNGLPQIAALLAVPVATLSATGFILSRWMRRSTPRRRISAALPCTAALIVAGLLIGIDSTRTVLASEGEAESFVRLLRRHFFEPPHYSQAWEVFIDPNYRQSEVSPRLPDGTPVSLSPGQDPRVPLYEWLIAEPHHTAARNIVNRIWAELFGVGLVEPLDEVGTGAAGAHDELLTALTDEFISHEWSLRHLLRTIVTSETFQRSVDPQQVEVGEYREYASWTPRRLTSLQVMAAVEVATNVRFEFSSTGNLYRYAPLRFGLEPPGRRSGTRALQLLCPSHGGRSYDSVESALFLLCDPDLTSCITSDVGRVQQLIDGNESNEEIVEALFLACYARPPSDDERQNVLRYIAETPSDAPWQDVMWSLLNSEEFHFLW